jgi:hypothetical protein
MSEPRCTTTFRHASLVALGTAAWLSASSLAPPRAQAYLDGRTFEDDAVNGGGGGRLFTGAPGDGYDCSVCHRGGAPLALTVEGIPSEGWEPGRTYVLAIPFPEGARNVGAVIEVADERGRRRHAGGPRGRRAHRGGSLPRRRTCRTRRRGRGSHGRAGRRLRRAASRGALDRAEHTRDLPPRVRERRGRGRLRRPQRGRDRALRVCAPRARRAGARGRTTHRRLRCARRLQRIAVDARDDARPHPRRAAPSHTRESVRRQRTRRRPAATRFASSSGPSTTSRRLSPA